MSFDLTNKNISATFQNVLQRTGSDNHLYDLEGNKVGDLRISGSLIAQEYIVSSSVTNISIATLSGSTAFGNSVDDTHQFTGNITASGQISSSDGFIGNLTGQASTIENSLTAGTGVDFGNGLSGQTFNGSAAQTLNLDLTEVIASDGANRVLTTDGDGTLTAQGKLSFDGNDLSITGDLSSVQHITASGNISQSITGGINYLGGHLLVKGKIQSIGSDVTIENGNISASGDISGSLQSTGSFGHIITSGETIEFIEGSNKLGSLKFDSSNGLQVKDANDAGGKLQAKILTVANELYSNGFLRVTGAISGSVISGSHVGDGSGLTGVTGEWDGTHTGTATFTGGAITASGIFSSSNNIIADKLYVNGGEFIMHRDSILDGPQIELRNDNKNNAAQSTMYFSSGSLNPDKGRDTAGIRYVPNTSKIFYIENFQSEGRVIINTSGSSVLTAMHDHTSQEKRVGIGTTSPGKTLEVVGDISSSGTITANAFDVSNIVTNHITASGGIKADGNISASGELQAGELHLHKRGAGSNEHLLTVKEDDHTKYYIDEDGDSWQIGQHYIELSQGGGTPLTLDRTGTSGDQYYLMVMEDGNEMFWLEGVSNNNGMGMYLEGANSYFDLRGTTDATDASGDTGALRVEGGASIAKKVFVGTDLNIGGKITSNITASGNISSSGNLQVDSYIQTDSHITASGNISSSGIITADSASFSYIDMSGTGKHLHLGNGSYITFDLNKTFADTHIKGGENYLNLDGDDYVNAYADIEFKADSPSSQFTGNITASGTISASGVIYGGSFNASGKNIGAYDGTKVILGSTNTPINIAGNITASGDISSSGEFIGNKLKITDATGDGTGDIVTEIYSSGDEGIIDIKENNSATVRLRANGLSYFNGGTGGNAGLAIGQNSLVGTSILTVDGDTYVDGNITASGNISGSSTSTLTLGGDIVTTGDVDLGQNITQTKDVNGALFHHFRNDNAGTLNQMGLLFSSGSSNLYTGNPHASFRYYPHSAKLHFTAYQEDAKISFNTSGSSRAMFQKGGAWISGSLTVNPHSKDGGGHITASGNISQSLTSTGSFGHIMKGGVNWDTAVSASAQAAGFGSGGGGGGGMTSFQLEDGDGTEVAISDAKEVKFVEGGGIDINWTDTDNGTDGDPYDLTFTINAAQTDITSIYATDLKIGEDSQTAIDFETGDEIHFDVNNSELVNMKAGSMDVTGNVSASANLIVGNLNTTYVSASGGHIKAKGTTSDAASKLKVGGSIWASGSSGIAHITASGNISSSATIIGNKINVGDVVIDATNSSITASSMRIVGSSNSYLNQNDTHFLYGSLTTTSITASSIRNTGNLEMDDGDQIILDRAATTNATKVWCQTNNLRLFAQADMYHQAMGEHYFEAGLGHSVGVWFNKGTSHSAGGNTYGYSRFGINTGGGASIHMPTASLEVNGNLHISTSTSVPGGGDITSSGNIISYGNISGSLVQGDAITSTTVIASTGNLYTIAGNIFTNKTNGIISGSSSSTGSFARVDALDGVVLKSPDGSLFRVKVDNSGNLSTEGA